MSLSHFRTEGNDGAARWGTERLRYRRVNRQGRGLPLTVVSLHIKPFAFDRSEMASDKYRFVSNLAL